MFLEEATWGSAGKLHPESDCTTVRHLGLIRFPNVLTQSAVLNSKYLLAMKRKIFISAEKRIEQHDVKTGTFC